MALDDLINEHIRGLAPYEPGKPMEELERELGISESVKLASNENPLGPSPRAVEAMRLCADQIHRYPDGASFKLRTALAGRLDVAESQLIFGCGGDEVLELMAKTLLAPGDEVVFGWPSFAMYPIVVRGMGATPVQVPLDADLVLDLGGILGAITERTKLVFLCNPNNPTGTSFGREAFASFARELPDDVVLCVDEAYREFVRRDDFPDSIALTRERPGTLVLRTFSKIYGLAGMRVGYGVGDTGLVGYLERARHPFNVNRMAEVAALAALDDQEHADKTYEMNAEGIEFLTAELKAMGHRVWPTDANFLLVQIGPGYYEKLLRHGVIVRPMNGFGLPEHLRISIGTPSENQTFVKALQAIAEEGE